MSSKHCKKNGKNNGAFFVVQKNILENIIKIFSALHKYLTYFPKWSNFI